MWLNSLEGGFMEYTVLSSLEKIFNDYKFDKRSVTSFSMLANERFNFQIALRFSQNINVSISLLDELAGFTNIYTVNDVPVGLPHYEDSDDYYIDRGPGLYPDLLIPFDGKFDAEEGKVYRFWFEVDPEANVTGNKELVVRINNEVITVNIDIISAMLPALELIYTNWYHSDCLCDYYGVEAMSDDYWRINENFIRTAASYGMNCILTPLFTPPLDTQIGGERTTVQLIRVKTVEDGWKFDFSLLKKWINLCIECGIENFEMSHFFTQWGAKHAPKIIATDENGNEKRIFGWDTPTDSEEYDRFLESFGKELCRFIEENNLGNNVFFHISDEPSEDNIKTYEKRASLIKRVFGKYPVMDALSDFEFYKRGTVDIPVPSEGHIVDFAGKVPRLWTYYCCGQHKNFLPNRFMAMPSLRNRIIGLLAYKYDLKGFLQWGFNFYNSQYSLRHINPYEVTDADGAFPSGDAFMVYPAPDGTAYPSLRLKVFYDAIQDLRALKLLENFVGREKVLEMLGDITFSDYTHSETEFLEFRNKVNKLIKENAGKE